MNQITDGIYLKSKASRVGTGHTASNVTFRSFYLVRSAGERVECFLLDDKLNPTGIKESLTPGDLAQKSWQHLPQLQKRYPGICAKLAAPPAVKEPAQAPQARPAPPPPAAKPESPPPAQKRDKPEAGEGNWWELTAKGSGDLFKK